MFERPQIDRNRRLFSNALVRGSLVGVIGFGVVIIVAAVELILR